MMIKPLGGFILFVKDSKDINHDVAKPHKCIEFV